MDSGYDGPQQMACCLLEIDSVWEKFLLLICGLPHWIPEGRIWLLMAKFTLPVQRCGLGMG